MNGISIPAFYLFKNLWFFHNAVFVKANKIINPSFVETLWQKALFFCQCCKQLPAKSFPFSGFVNASSKAYPYTFSLSMNWLFPINFFCGKGFCSSKNSSIYAFLWKFCKGLKGVCLCFARLFWLCCHHSPCRRKGFSAYALLLKEARFSNRASLLLCNAVRWFAGFAHQ